MLEVLPWCAALVGRSGNVVACNEPWVRFHAERGAGDGYAVGGDVLAARDAATGADGSLGVGLRRVLDGLQGDFEREDEVPGQPGRRHRTIVRRVLAPDFDGAIVLRVDVTPHHEPSERQPRAQLDLERLVGERTAELSRANVLLQYEIDERHRASTARNRLLDLAAVVTFSDVTEWRTVERQLRTSETRYRLASRAVRDAIWDLDVVSERIDWSDGITLRIGHPPETAGRRIASAWRSAFAPRLPARRATGRTSIRSAASTAAGRM